MGLGKRLKDILKKKNITVQRLSEMTGISANTLYTIIKRDNKSMQAENLINIARTLNVSIDELLGETMYVDTVENISALLSSGKATPADVAPVVRCKDCKHWHRALLKFEDESFGICDFMKDDIDTDEKDFCSRGEKLC